jgi:hypothetical protein
MNRTVYAACALTLALGLIFIFVAAPHPWSWEGFDHYHQLALEVARGRPFPTLEVPWGYAYFLAAFYRTFGDHPVIPLLVQVGLNAFIPLFVFVAAREWFDQHIAAIAALFTGLFSFNTIYASTQSSDAVCTVLFMAAVVAFVVARRDDKSGWFATAGVLAGLAPQFRPNLVLVPLLLAAFAIVEYRSWRRARQAALLLVCAAAMLMPWIVRNYRLTRMVMPTSVHGAVQLWYGTLQVGPYLSSKAYNPRTVFDGPAFDYTSLTDVPLVVVGQVNPCLPAIPVVNTMWYWTDRDPVRRRVDATAADRSFDARLPAPGAAAVLYYYFESRCDEGGVTRTQRTPRLGERAPFVYFMSGDHLGDLDVHADLLDVFDLIRLVRHEAWHEPLPYADRLAGAGIADLATAVDALTPTPAAGFVPAPAPRLVVNDENARLELDDGSSIVVPHQWSGRITDVGFDKGLALALMHSGVSLAALQIRRAEGAPARVNPITAPEDLSINRVFYRSEPHMMRRYYALAMDNIRRDVPGFLLSCLYRAVRLFVIEGTADPFTATQFEGSRAIYAAATAASAAYLLLFIAGVVMAWRAGFHVVLALVLILYIPATIAPVLTNMRYTVTVQPLVFMFCAVVIAGLQRRLPITAIPAASIQR